MQNGILLKGIGGFYYVKTADGLLECKAKGIFRKRGVTPLAGDRVGVEGEEGGFVVSQIEPRKNSFTRPPIANVDRLFLVVSSRDPRPNLAVADELIAISLVHGVKPVVVLTKTDLESADGFARIYRRAGFAVIDLRADEAAGYAEICREAEGCLSVFIGNSGVGKSTLLNGLCPALGLETGETSRKLGRGRHTTRAVELYPFAGGWLADTPGFSALDFERAAPLTPADVVKGFPEFAPYLDGCYFAGCSHTVEKGCAVLAALRAGEIEPTRHENYCALARRARELERKYD